MKRAVRMRFKGSPRRLRPRSAGVISAPARAEDKNARAISVLRIARPGLTVLVPANGRRRWARGCAPWMSRGGTKKKTPPVKPRSVFRGEIRAALPAAAEVSAVHRRSGGTGTGIGVLQPVTLRLLELFLGQIQGQPVVIGLQIPQGD